jgi:hypothetical protein
LGQLEIRIRLHTLSQLRVSILSIKSFALGSPLSVSATA